MIYWDFVDNIKEGMTGQIGDHMGLKQGVDLGISLHVIL
jgi:hypothetical protein